MRVRRAALNEVGPLDEGYFLPCEDLDWFVRFVQATWKMYLVPDVEVVHRKSVCSACRPLLVILGIWLRFLFVALDTGLRLTLARLSQSTQRRSTQ